ncbi:hypothetical protein CBER1_08378 [Cercospora berteroae]|uniref:DUF6604 domain-containing protein n=1 Tax=Cercospora berteroae TaxID=357750 RepID=A0A2S6CG96_9PEZI|nr:hypothetical protein CBER1_08378 [Cercospora berteroae]
MKGSRGTKADAIPRVQRIPLPGCYEEYKKATDKVFEYLNQIAQKAVNIAQYMDKDGKLRREKVVEVARAAVAPFDRTVIDLHVEVIDARQASVCHFEALPGSSKASNEGHGHFLDELRKVHEPTTTSPSSAGRSKSKPQRKTTAQPKPTPVAEESEDDDSESSFAAWCLLRDFDDVHHFVMQAFEAYSKADNTVSFNTCCVLAELAYGLMRVANEKFAATFRELGDWNALVARFGLQVQAEGKITIVTPCSLADSQVEAVPSTTPSADIVRSLRAASATLLQRLHVQIVAGSKETSTKFRRFVLVQTEFDFGEVLLSQARMIQIVLEAQTEAGTTFHHSELLDGIIAYLSSGQLPLWLVIAMDLECRIYEVTGSDAPRASELYLDNVKRIEQQFQPAIEQARGQKDDVIEAMKREFSRRDEMERQFRISDDVTTARTRYGIPASAFEQLTCKPLFHVSGTPTSAMRKSFLTQLMDTKAVCERANDEACILSIAHLYTACRHYGLVKMAWPDMDLFLKYHAQQLNLSGDTSSDHYGLLKRFMEVLGVHRPTFRGRQSTKPPIRRQVARNCNPLQPMSILVESLYRRAANQEHGLEEDDLVTSVLTELTPADERYTADLTTRNKRKDLTLTQLLNTLLAELKDAEPMLNFDYLRLRAMCGSLGAELTDFINPHGSDEESTAHKLTYDAQKSAADAKAQDKQMLKFMLIGTAAKVLEEFIKKSGDVLSQETSSLAALEVKNRCQPFDPEQPRSFFEGYLRTKGKSLTKLPMTIVDSGAGQLTFLAKAEASEKDVSDLLKEGNDFWRLLARDRVVLVQHEEEKAVLSVQGLVSFASKMARTRRTPPRADRNAYKSATDRVVNFLVAAASRQGSVTAYLNHDGRPKVNRLPHLAAAVSEPVADSIFDDIRSAIDGREADLHYHITHEGSTLRDIADHQHMVSMLRQVRGILYAHRQPRAGRQSDKANTTQPQPEKSVSQQFSHLQVCEPSASPLGKAPSTGVSFSKGNRAAAFNLLQQFQEVENHVLGLWRSLPEGDGNLLTCGVVTNAAYFFMRDLERTFVTAHPLLHSWDRFAELLEVYVVHRGKMVFVRPLEAAVQHDGGPGKTGAVFETINEIRPAAASLLNDVHSKIKLAEQKKTNSSSPLVLDSCFDFGAVLRSQIQEIQTNARSGGRRGARWEGLSEFSPFNRGLLEFNKTSRLPIWLVYATAIEQSIYEIVGSEPGLASDIYLDAVAQMSDEFALDQRAATQAVGPLTQRMQSHFSCRDVMEQDFRSSTLEDQVSEPSRAIAHFMVMEAEEPLLNFDYLELIEKCWWIGMYIGLEWDDPWAENADMCVRLAYTSSNSLESARREGNPIQGTTLAHACEGIRSLIADSQSGIGDELTRASNVVPGKEACKRLRAYDPKHAGVAFEAYLKAKGKDFHGISAQIINSSAAGLTF